VRNSNDTWLETTEGEMSYPTEFNNGNTMNVNPCRVTLTTTAAEFARVRAVAVKALRKTAGVEFYGSSGEDAVIAHLGCNTFKCLQVMPQKVGILSQLREMADIWNRRA